MKNILLLLAALLAVSACTEGVQPNAPKTETPKPEASAISVESAMPRPETVSTRLSEPAKTVSKPKAVQKTAKKPAKKVNASSRDLQCLTEVIYFEARGESTAGKRAVAHVVLNRARSKSFPGSICGVVAQRNSKACQFSYRCDGKPEIYREAAAKASAQKVAKAVLNGDADLTNGAKFFHTTNTRPSWSKRLKRTTRIGNHYFYR